MLQPLIENQSEAITMHPTALQISYSDELISDCYTWERLKFHTSSMSKQPKASALQYQGGQRCSWPRPQIFVLELSLRTRAVLEDTIPAGSGSDYASRCSSVCTQHGTWIPVVTVSTRLQCFWLTTPALSWSRPSGLSPCQTVHIWVTNIHVCRPNYLDLTSFQS